MTTTTPDRWLVVPGTNSRNRVTTRRGTGTGMSATQVRDFKTGEAIYPTIIFHVPGEFIDAYRRGRP